MTVSPEKDRHGRYQGMLVTDLDGTLRKTDGTFHPRDMRTLEALGGRGILRVIATGRSPYSLNQAIPPDFPIDYLLFSSGAGVIRWSDKKMIRHINIHPGDVDPAAAFLIESHFDFMIHDPPPENHAFQFHRANPDNLDFQRRLDIYAPFARPLDRTKKHHGPSTQFVVVVNGMNGPDAYDCIKREFSELSIIRTTSPLDHQSVWVEIFHRDVSKSRTSTWLAEKNNIPRENVMSIGNDYNDLDLLAWAGQAYVVGNSPLELGKRFTRVASNDEAGVTEAVACWPLLLS
jgi:hydroxymethylpyrimidine pyrophosphatase-like HAD family hydrolase